MSEGCPPGIDPALSSVHAAQIAEPLLEWYAREGRKLPWRDIGDPYRILVSEIMLQQTRVSTVLNYYPAFLKRFPTVADLAAASEDEVLALWSGLGFYRRARNLHACARELMCLYRGEVPKDPKQLGDLPGIGRYTVGAVLSAAHNARLPILDGNVIRVLSRLFCIAGDPGSARVNKQLWWLAGEVLPEDRPGDFNQSLMDLGATVCKAVAPSCGDCPLANLCDARAAGVTEDYPHAGRRTRVTRVQRVALFVARPDGSFLLHRRPSSGLLAGMWELPARILEENQEPSLVAGELSVQLGIPGSPSKVITSEHRFSHRHWTTQVYRAEAQDRAQDSGRYDGVERELRWTHVEELPELALPEASHKTLRPCLELHGRAREECVKDERESLPAR